MAPASRRSVVRGIGGATAGLIAAGGGGAFAAGLEFNSPYNFIYIEKAGSLVSFNYSLVAGRMSAVDLARPAFQQVAYTRYYYAADLIRPGPRNVLMAGLGAGGFNRLLGVVHPDARLVTVEIDPMIQKLAEEHAGFRAGPNNRVVIDDARIHLRRSRETFDWILLDAFDKDAQIPVHLATREFYETLRDRLADDGVMAANLHQGTRFFGSHVMTIRAVFPDVVLVPVDGRSNVIVVAVKSPAGSVRSRLKQPGAEMRARYRENGVDLDEIARNVTYEADYLPYFGEDGTVLTDDFAPVESLARESAPSVQPRR